MFGYIKVSRAELKVREDEYYRGTYCGLCRSMGTCTGQCSRMTLSYDFAFLALLRITCCETTVTFKQKRCLVHPLKKRNVMENNPSLSYCAGAAALLNYHKLMDDLSDEKGGKRLRAILLRPFLSHARKKAIRKQHLEALDQSIACGLNSLAEAEHASLVSVDVPAERFGTILSDIMSYGLDGTNARIMAAFGSAVGKWIYIADALDDWQEDAVKHRYNPFLLLYGKDAPTPSERETIQNALKNELYDAEAALNLISFSSPDIQSILFNILYLGMPQRIEQMSRNSTEKADEKRNRKKGHRNP